MSNTVIVDDRQIKHALSELNKKDRLKAEISALRSSANILRRETIRQFAEKANLKEGYKRNLFDLRKGEIVTKSAKIATVVVDKREPSAKVHILGDFRAKFFEMGTNKRYTKGHRLTGKYYRLKPGGRKYRERTGKGGYRGYIRPVHPFRTAQQLTERKIFDNMNKRINSAIQRVWRKYR